MKSTQALHEAGQSLWLDNITRALLDGGILARYVDEYLVTGLTSNPTIFDKAIEDGTAYDADIAARKASGASDKEVFFELALADLRRAADLFVPVHARTDRVDGWVSLEVSPLLAHDTQTTVEQAQGLHRRAALDNLFINIPDPEAPDVLYVEALAVPFTVDTMPDHTLEAFADHGTLGDLLLADGGDADQVIAAFARAGVDTSALAGELQRQGAEAFAASWQDLLARIGARHEQLSR